ncbi:MAG: type I DNA topoisomerase [Thermoanaerobacteraceae bacterium]|nr:type I DNA topoisomerase [Thermoanaerobacteraceae bacterium]
MGKTLVIVESPAKAKTISKFLGHKYIVKSSMGHVRDLPRSQFGVDVENDFQPKYITIRGKGEILKELRQEAKKSDNVLLAPDPDREGEAIAWHLAHALKVNTEEKCRIQFNEITKNAVTSAVKNPRKIDYNLVDAQQARRILDRLVGYNLSPLLWRKVKKGLSAGRVQSVAVRLICEREEEIENFTPEEYWTLTAVFKVDETEIEAKLNKHRGKKIKIKNGEQMQQVLEQLKNSSFVIEDIKKRDTKRTPAPPYITSSLQQDAYRKLNFTAKKTMRIAQQLYEGVDIGREGSVGLITYIRTDSTRIAETAQEEARKFIEGQYGRDYVPEKPRSFTNKKSAQNAHEAIRPTSIFRTPSQLRNKLSHDQYRLYQLIWRRFLASQMAEAVLESTTVLIAAGDYQFRATGSVIKFPGFFELYKNTDDFQEKENLLPELSVGMQLELVKLDDRQHFTQPPPRYSEASLVKTLEEKGIGRPSTYAPIIDTILSRGYVVREDKQFRPTELGQVVVQLLKEYFPDIVDVEFTAHLESELDEIEEGHRDWKDVVEEFYEPFKAHLDRAEKEIGQVEIQDEETDVVCEKCGRNMVIKYGRYGKFLACPGFPECRNTKPLLEEIGVKCPDCGGGIVERRSKKGRKFYGCSNYPQCKFVSWHKPTEERCPECDAFLVEKHSKKQDVRLECSSKECNFWRSIKNKAKQQQGEAVQ